MADPSVPAPEPRSEPVLADARRVLERLDALPTIPLVAHQVGDLVNDPRSDAQKIAAVLRGDQSLTAKVLKLVNSPYYAIPGGVSDVGRAISFIGFNTLHQLVLTVSVFDALRSASGEGVLDPRALWKHALGTGLLAEVIARRIGFGQPEDCFTAGLLHDIGKVALLHAVREDFLRAVAYARDHGTTVHDAEHAVGLPSHEQVGLQLARKWRFPQRIFAPIEHHHETQPARRSGLPQNLHPIVDLVGLANVLCRKFEVGDPGDRFVPDLDPAIFARLNLSPAEVENLHGELLRAIDRSKAFRELFESG